MKKILIVFLLLFTNANANDFKLEKIIEGFDSPELDIYRLPKFISYRKAGNIKYVNLKRKMSDISHDLNVLEDGQDY